jgi:hypothetical protein
VPTNVIIFLIDGNFSSSTSECPGSRQSSHPNPNYSHLHFFNLFKLPAQTDFDPKKLGFSNKEFDAQD